MSLFVNTITAIRQDIMIAQLIHNEWLKQVELVYRLFVNITRSLTIIPYTLDKEHTEYYCLVRDVLEKATLPWSAKTHRYRHQ